MMNRNNIKNLFNKNFILLFFIQVLNVSNFSIFGTTIPIWMKDKFNSDPAEVGLIIGLSGISSIFTRLFISYVLDRFGRKKVLQISIFLGGAISLLFLLVKNPTMILLIRFIQLIPFVSASTALITMAVDIIPEERRGEGLSYFTTSTTLPLAIGPTVGLELYNVKWTAPFIFAAGIGIVSLLITFLLSIPGYVSRREKNHEGFKNIGQIALVALISAISFLVLPTIFSFIPLYAQELSININRIGSVYTSYAVGLLIVRLIGAKTIDHISPKITGTVAFLFLIFGLVSIGSAKQLLGLIFGGLLVGAGAGIILPTLLMMAINLAPNKRGFCNAMIYGGVDVANSIGASLFGIITNYFSSFSPSYFIFGGIEFLGLIVFMIVTMPNYLKNLQFDY